MRAIENRSRFAHAAKTEPDPLFDRMSAGLLLLVALAHAVPALAAFDADLLPVFYGVAAVDPNLEVLLRHRAMLFGIVAGILALGAFVPAYRMLALGVGWVSVVSFLDLAMSTDGISDAVRRVVLVDLGLGGALVIATGLLAWRARKIPSRP